MVSVAWVGQLPTVVLRLDAVQLVDWARAAVADRARTTAASVAWNMVVIVRGRLEGERSQMGDS